MVKSKANCFTELHAAIEEMIEFAALFQSQLRTLRSDSLRASFRTAHEALTATANAFVQLLPAKVFLKARFRHETKQLAATVCFPAVLPGLCGRVERKRPPCCNAAKTVALTSISCTLQVRKASFGLCVSLALALSTAAQHAAVAETRAQVSTSQEQTSVPAPLAANSAVMRIPPYLPPLSLYAFFPFRLCLFSRLLCCTPPGRRGGSTVTPVSATWFFWTR